MGEREGWTKWVNERGDERGGRRVDEGWTKGVDEKGGRKGWTRRENERGGREEWM